MRTPKANHLAIICAFAILTSLPSVGWSQKFVIPIDSIGLQWGPYTETHIGDWKAHIATSLVGTPIGDSVTRLIGSWLTALNSKMGPHAIEASHSIGIWIDSDLSSDFYPYSCDYHPSAKWLEEHAYNVNWQRSIQIPSAKRLLSDPRARSLFISSFIDGFDDHQYHFQPEAIAELLDHLQKSGKLTSFMQSHGIRESGITLNRRFFSAMSTAYLDHSDYYPRTRIGIKDFDSQTYKFLEGAWGE